MASNDNSPRVDMAKLEAEVTLPRVSAVTAETVTRDFESALKEIEAMGAELISVAKKCEAMTTDVQSTIRETAAAYRQEGKEDFRAYRGARAVHRGHSQDMRRCYTQDERG